METSLVSLFEPLVSLLEPSFEQPKLPATTSVIMTALKPIDINLLPPKMFVPELARDCPRQCMPDSVYRLTWRLVPPPGPPPMGPRAPLPLETTLTQSASLSLKYEVSLALRSASRLFCGAPEA